MEDKGNSGLCSDAEGKSSCDPIHTLEAQCSYNEGKAIIYDPLHTSRLQGICRLCGKELKNVQTYPKHLFKEDILKSKSICVDDEVNEMFPARICKTDAREFYRLRAGKCAESSYISRLETPIFYKLHSDDCSLCSNKVTLQGRPKRKSSLQKAEIGSKKIKMDSTGAFTSEGCQPNTHGPTDKTFYPEDTDESFILKQFIKFLRCTPNLRKIDFFSSLMNELSGNDLSLLSYCLGRKISHAASKDADSQTLLYKDMNAMADFNVFDWMKERNVVLVSLLLGASGSDTDLASVQNQQQKLLSISRAVEHFYLVSYPKFISPLSFLLNVCSYALSGSKSIVDMYGNASPAGHYKTVTQWLRDQSTPEVETPEGNILNVFDNEQVIGRKNQIKPSSKTEMSIITNKGFIALSSDDHDDCLQVKPQLKPLQVLKSIQADSTGLSTEQNKKLVTAVNEVMDQSSPRYVQYERDHYEQLFYFIDNAIEDVIKEQETEGQHITDTIDITAARQSLEELMVQCSCGKWNGLKKITCDGCKQRDGLKQAKERRKSYSANDSIKQVKPSLHRITFKTDENQTIVEEEDEERYQQVQSNHSEKHNIVLTDPVYCNPNSMETVARVLRKIGTENGIVRYGGTKREWTFVCCDGLPFMICKKLKEEAVICIEPDCKKKFLTRKEFTLHADQEHPDAKNCQFMYEFDWFYLRIGAGHYEMNLLKAFFELNWIPFLEVLCEKMGFLSDAAKMYAKACKDTHKSWHLLMVFHTSGLRELVIPYVRNCMVNGKTPEAKEFFHFTQTMYSEENSNLKYLMDTVCRFSQGIINYRMGVRRNNAQLMKSAKYMTKELFSARSHPKYQAIEVFDTLQDILMPIEVSELNDKYSSFSTTGNKSLGEDADFVLEEKNRQLKSWIPKGIPSDLIWQSVCRNNEVLEKVKGNCLNLFRVQNSQGKTKPVNLEEAIMEFRTAIRKDRYLQKYGVHTSLSGLILDGDLVNLIEGATKRRMFYLRSEILGEGIEAPALRHPVPVTIEERLKFNSVNSMNLNEIKKEISELLELIQDPLVQDYHEKLYNTEVKGKVKARHVQFLQELKEAMSGNDGNSEES